MDNSISEDDALYFNELLLRRHMAVRPTFRSVGLANGKSPEPSKCHANAESFVVGNSGYVVVRGWLIETPLNALVAHSLVRLREGKELIEITVQHPYAFIEHMGACLIFDRLSKQHPRMNVDLKL